MIKNYISRGKYQKCITIFVKYEFISNQNIITSIYHKMSILTNETNVIEFKTLPKTFLLYELSEEATEKPQEDPEESDAESLEKWASKDCKLQISQKEGFMCNIKVTLILHYLLI